MAGRPSGSTALTEAGIDGEFHLTSKQNQGDKK
jgi:hypothetical protein